VTDAVTKAAAFVIKVMLACMAAFGFMAAGFAAYHNLQTKVAAKEERKEIEAVISTKMSKEMHNSDIAVTRDRIVVLEEADKILREEAGKSWEAIVEILFILREQRNGD